MWFKMFNMPVVPCTVNIEAPSHHDFAEIMIKILRLGVGIKLRPKWKFTIPYIILVSAEKCSTNKNKSRIGTQKVKRNMKH